MQTRILLSTATALSLAMACAASAQDRLVNVYNWFDYIDPSILEDFSEETGIKVVYDTFDSNELLETKLLAGNSGYDVVVPTANFLARQIQAGVFQELDKSRLSNLPNMWDEINERTAVYDPGNKYSVNYMWGTIGIGYNEEKIKEVLGLDMIDSWDIVFKAENMTKLKACGVHILDSPADILPITMNYLGLDPASTSSDDIAKAAETLLAVRGDVRKFHSSEYTSALANGDICLAVGWAGDVYMAANRAAEAKQSFHIKYVIPKEGTLMWFDMLAIPADAPHVAEAHELINYLMRPEVIAKASDFVFYANGNKASQPLLDKAILDDPAIYPTPDVLANLFTVPPYDTRTQRVITRTWTSVVTGQ